MLINEKLKNEIKVYAFVGPSGTGKSYRAQMVASERDIPCIIDDGLLIKENEVLAGESAKKAPTKVGTVKHALFYEQEERDIIIRALKKEKPKISKHITKIKIEICFLVIIKIFMCVTLL
mgnify:CR=1 FL=1